MYSKLSGQWVISLETYSCGDSNGTEMSDSCDCHSLCVVYISRLTKIYSSLGRLLQILTALLLYSRPLSAPPLPTPSLLSTSLTDSSLRRSCIILSFYLLVRHRPFFPALACKSSQTSFSISSTSFVHPPLLLPSWTHIPSFHHFNFSPPPYPPPLRPFQDGAILFLHHLSSSFSLSAVIIRSSARIRRLNPANSASGSCEVELDLCKPSRIRGSTSLASCSHGWRKLTGSGLMLWLHDWYLPRFFQLFKYCKNVLFTKWCERGKIECWG